MVLDDHCTRASAVNSQSRLFSDTRAGNAGFQSAMAKLNGASFAPGSAAGFGLAARLRAEVFKYENADRRR